MSEIYAIHPNGDNIVFHPDAHAYIHQPTGKAFESVTTFIGKFFPKFNASKIAEKCAGKGKYANMRVEEILEAWEADAYRGRTEGTCAHEYAECSLKGRPTPQAISDRCRKLFVSVELGLHRLAKHYEYVDAEAIVFDIEHQKAGTIDLLVYQKESKTLAILDWKNNKQIKTGNQWERAFEPIAHLEACDLVKYSLQLSMYKKILEENGYWASLGYEKIALGLIHLQPGTHPVMIKIEPMDKEIGDMLRHDELK